MIRKSPPRPILPSTLQSRVALLLYAVVYPATTTPALRPRVTRPAGPADGRGVPASLAPPPPTAYTARCDGKMERSRGGTGWWCIGRVAGLGPDEDSYVARTPGRHDPWAGLSRGPAREPAEPVCRAGRAHSSGPRPGFAFQRLCAPEHTARRTDHQLHRSKHIRRPRHTGPLADGPGVC